MLVSGMMSDNETTSSFPDRLPELSKAPPASMLKQRKDNLYDMMTNTREIKYIYYTVQSYDPITALRTCAKKPGQDPCLQLCALQPLQTCEETSNHRLLKCSCERKD